MNEQKSLIYNKALDILSRREHSEKELVQKLKNKFVEHDLIDEVTSKLINNNLLNDLRFAEAYTVSRKRKGFGPKKISFELQGKGLREKEVESVLTDIGGWNQAALVVFKKKFPEGKTDDLKVTLKQKNFLTNRGFRFREIESVFGDDMLWFIAMSYEVLARKYRPSNFDQVIGQEHIVEALANGINQKRLHQAYIFSDSMLFISALTIWSWPITSSKSAGLYFLAKTS